MKVNTEHEEDEAIKNAEKEGMRLIPLSSFYHDITHIKKDERNTYVMNYAFLDTTNLDSVIQKLERVFA